ncbi:MAG: sugar ABC transporter permease [Vampirovibrionales bacterium]|nr:sugar ABC transporter permease [Vampirovibrionales bacterium]
MFFKQRTPYLYLALPLLMMAIFFFMPFFMALGISAMDYGENLYAPKFTGLANYLALWHSGSFWQSLGNTFFFLFGVVPAMVCLPILLAIALNTDLKGISIFRSVIYLPVIISVVVVGITWKWLYQKDGILNYGFTLFGLEAPEALKSGWLLNPDVAIYAVMLVIVWKGLAYYMMMYLAHLQSLSRELYESADLDGAGWLERHWHVTLPHLRPTMVMVAIISTIGCLKIFAEIYVLTKGGPVGTTRTLVYFIYQRAFENLDLGIASAAGIVLMTILLVLSLIQLKYTGFGQTAENTKTLSLQEATQ